MFTLGAGKCFINSFHDGVVEVQWSIETGNSEIKARAKRESYIQGGESFTGRAR